MEQAKTNPLIGFTKWVLKWLAIIVGGLTALVLLLGIVGYVYRLLVPSDASKITVFVNNTLNVVESPEGLSPPGAPRTLREPLD